MSQKPFDVVAELEDLMVTWEQRQKYYDFGKYMKHEPECLPPRGDQSCKCGRNQTYCNLDAQFDEFTESVPYNPAYVSTLRKCIDAVKELRALPAT